MAKYLMALDQGTTSSRCILFEKNGKIHSMAQKEFSQIYPQPGWVEHDPREIWASQLAVTTEAMAKVMAQPEDIAAIGITNQRETTIIWDRKSGEPIYNAIVWQCRRTADRIDELVALGYSDLIKEKTGLIPDAYFSATKIAWILDHVDGARERAERGELLFGTVDSWLIYNLTKGEVHVTDYTNASRTMLFDIHKLCWDKELLALFRIPECMLPKVKPSSCIYGYTESSVLGGEIPIAGIAGDQQAALFGQCCFEKGQVKNTYGTGCFLLMNTGREAIASKHGLLTTIAASTSDQVEYALEGSVFVAGAAIQWLRDGMRMIKKASETEKYANGAEDTGGVYLVPAFAMEEDVEVSIAGLKVDGGASANDFLMQFQSDILGARVYRPECIETTALGAAYLAGLACGYYKDRDEIKENWQLSTEFTHQMGEEHRRQLLKGWRRAVRCALVWADDEDRIIG